MQKKQKFFPNAKLRCALFAKEDTALILDRQEYEGDLFFLIEKAQEYIMNLRTASCAVSMVAAGFSPRHNTRNLKVAATLIR